jgi:hypothetical protein
MIRKLILELFNGVTKEEHTKICKDYDSVLFSFENDNEVLYEKIVPHHSLKQFKEEGLNIRTKKQYYGALQDGAFQTKAWHEFLEIDDETKAEYLKVFHKVVGSSVVYKNADELVYNFLERFPSRVNVKYKLDKDKFGKTEYIESAKELMYEYTHETNLVGDCDAIGSFFFHCLMSALEVYFPGDTWRLRNNIVLFYGVNAQPYRHWNLGWVRGDDINDVVFIETSLQAERRLANLNNPIRFQNNYKVELCFDYDTEYSGWYK